MELREFCFGNGICSLCVYQLSMNAPCTGDHTGGVMVSVLTSWREQINFSAISWREQVNLQWDDDDVRFFLDQHA
jgi:hypothetical protein